jgi:hypothetical protein
MSGLEEPGHGLPFSESFPEWGYIPPQDFCRPGAIFGAIVLGALLCIGIPFLLW